MRKIFYLLPIIAFATACFFLVTKNESPVKRAKLSKKEDIKGALEDRLFTSSDVDLGYIPTHKLLKAIEIGEKRVAEALHSRNLNGSLAETTWRERGPNNIGGRSRAIMIDEKDPNRNRIWAGGVSGGVWRTEDITQANPGWTKLGIHFETTSIGDIAQDPQDLNTIYVGTGESYTQDFLAVGVYKSTDDGETWTHLMSTRNFGYVNEIYVHTNSDVYVATSSVGLMRSTDGGNTWLKVLGQSLSGANNDDFHDIIFNETNQTFYASNDNSVFKSTSGNRGEWTNIGTAKPGFPTDFGRVELAVCPSNPNFIYVLSMINNQAGNIVVSNDGGESWTTRPAPAVVPGTDFTNGQAWYDLEISVDPANCGRLLAGGVGMLESPLQGLSWNPIAQGQIHVDHHYIQFDEKKSGRVFYGNDGGIWMSNNSGNSIMNKNQGYVTTQFYCGAIHPDVGSPYLLGGTQDNNSLQLTEPGLGPANSVWGGDGVFCFIDQNEPNIQIVSSQGGNYGLSTDGGESFGGGASINGNFINRSGYDDDANILYGEVNATGYFRWNVNTGSVDEVTFQALTMEVSAVKADPNFPNRVYFGGSQGRVVRVDNAHTGLSVPVTMIGDLPGNASVSSIYVDRQTSDHMLISLFNYGASLENVWVTYNAGSDWISIEGDLPDLPVRWAIFDPANHDRVMIATDAGVWVTDDVDGDQTHWVPCNPDNGMPFVRVDMLIMRESDKVVLGATHGRGLMTTDVFSAPAPVIIAQPISYEGQPLVIDGSSSVNAQSFEWDLGDSNTSTQEKFTHTYAAPGTYTIRLTINGSLTLTKTISVLPYLPAPYSAGVTEYSGDFESNPFHFAAHSDQGTAFQRGSSSKPGKDGTHSGTSAWVLGINDNVYENNTRAEFYTPQYDLSQAGLYELKFWTKFAIQNRNDGFQVEYSTDGGSSWFQLGTTNDLAWYNYLNQNIMDGAFTEGKSYFTNTQLTWTQYVKDISFLEGEPRVSFRFVFRSDDSDQFPGLAIDDFEITKYEGDLKTQVTVFDASHTDETEVTVNWTTAIEYQAQKFIVERSYSGFNFEEVGNVNATGKVTTVAQQYSFADQTLRDVIYYRLKVINDNPEINYHLEFYTDTIVLTRSVEPDVVHTILPNPFKERILVSFSSIIGQPVSVRLYDVSGRLIREEEYIPNDIAIEINNLNPPPGIYVLSIQVGENEPKSFKLFSFR